MIIDAAVNTEAQLQKNMIDSGLKKAFHFHKCGQLEKAERIYSKILGIMPGHADALHLLGLIYFEKGDTRNAEEFISRAIENDETVPLFYVSLGDVLQVKGNFSDAAACYRKALSLNPDLVEALCNMGNLLRQQGKFNHAIACYQKSLAINPLLPEVHNNMGLAYHKKNDYDAAVSCFKQSVSLKPDCADAYNNLGNVYRDQSKFKEAAEQYQHALQLRPKDSMINYNLGVLFQMQNDVDHACEFYQKAAEHKPEIPDAHNNLGKLHHDRNQLAQAIWHYNRAIQLSPEHTDAHFNRSLSYLAAGRYAEGWKGYEWRFKRKEWKKIYPHRLQARRWDGSDFSGKTLLVHSEQGFGDTLQFIRYLPQVKAKGGTVVFEMRPELYNLLKDFPGVDRGVPMSFEQPPLQAYDAYVPLMSLCGIFGTTLETIPNSVPYIHVSSEKREHWGLRISGSELKIGLAWAAKTTYKHEKSCLLENFFPLMDLPGTQFYGLQKGNAAEQLKNLSSYMINLGEEFETFADTAGAIDCLDLVISVDTAVAHLAGSMGKPVWVLLPFSADWRWLLERRDSPWYPTMRLFRQSQPGDWKPVMLQLHMELRQWIEAKLLQ